MTEYHPLDKYLDFQEATLEEPEFESTRITVRVHGLGIWKGFPGHEDRYFTFYEVATLVFENVISSRREIVQPTYQSSRETLEAGPFETTDQETFVFNLSGKSDTCVGNVHWEIQAASVHLENAQAGQSQFPREHPLSRLLEFAYSTFGTPEIGPSWIRIPMRELGVYPEFPGYSEYTVYETCVIVVEDVVSSTRTISDNSTGFVETKTIIDGPFPAHDQETLLFEFAGHTDDHPNPYASVYLTFEIMAASVRIEPGKKITPKAL